MEMNLGLRGATRQSWEDNNLRVAIREIIAKHPKAKHDRLVQLLAAQMRDDDDLLLAAADYAVANAVVALNRNVAPEPAPPSVRHPVSEEEREQRKQERDTIVESIKSQILMLNLEMPNGKRMRYCTGAEMIKFGGAYQRIGRKVGAMKMVGSVLGEKEVRAFIK